MSTNEMLQTTVADVVDVATRATKPHLVKPGETYVVTDTFGKPHIIDRDLDEYRDNPRRKTGTEVIHDADTFARYLKKHGTPDTEIWADTINTRIVAVINAHGEKTAGWADHRATFNVIKTPAWTAWETSNNKLLNQTAFAEHIEDRTIDIVKPLSAEMLEIAQSITATIGVTFESSKRLSSGEQQLEYKETVDAKAGNRGRLEIPSIIELGIVPFYGAAPYKLNARFRYRIHGGELKLAYTLERPEDVLRDAFNGLLNDISQRTGRDILLGQPSR